MHRPLSRMGRHPALVRLAGKGIAKTLVFTGERISAEEARELGIVNKVVKHEELMTYCRTLAQKNNGKQSDCRHAGEKKRLIKEAKFLWTRPWFWKRKHGLSTSAPRTE